MFLRSGTFGNCLVVCEVLREMIPSFHRGFPPLTDLTPYPHPWLHPLLTFPNSGLSLFFHHHPSLPFLFPLSHNPTDFLSLFFLLIPLAVFLYPFCSTQLFPASGIAGSVSFATVLVLLPSKNSLSWQRMTSFLVVKVNNLSLVLSSLISG